MLYISTWCPYARRTVYAASFKSANVEVVALDSDKKPQWFLEINPSGSVPVFRIKDSKCVISESLQIVEFLNSYQGTDLYPNRDGRVHLPGKAIVDIQISTNLDPLLFYLLKYERTGNQRSFETVCEILTEINEVFLKNGNYASDVLRYFQYTLADVILFPVIDHLFNSNDQRLAEVKRLITGNNIEKWYATIKETSWARSGKAKLEQLATPAKL